MTLFVEKYITRPDESYIRYRQSTIHGIARRYMPSNSQIEEMLSRQESMENHPSNVKVIVTGNKAYWIHKNQFYTSMVDDEGEIDLDNAKPVTTENLTDEEIDALMSIIDDLRRKEDDDSSSGN